MQKTNKTPPIGRCVFCGVTAEQLAEQGMRLTDEHVFPEGLHTDCVLTEATCPDCQKILHPFEQHCLREIFGAARAYLGAYGKQSERPDHLPLSFRADDGTKQTILVPLAEYPFGLVMPCLPPPGIFTGRGRTDGYAVYGTHEFQPWWCPDATERIALLEDRERRRVTMDVTIKLGDLCKLLAKMAHCFALFMYWDTYVQWVTPFLQNLITSPKNAAIEGPYFVGGSFWVPGTRITSIWNGGAFLHGIQLFQSIVNEVGYLAARIQLFAPLGMPVYEVVVGRVESSRVHLAS